jgi:ATP-binding cassette subfamily F protein 3
MIALEAVSKSYGAQAVLSGASLRLGRGERLGLVGPNGAGKTTLCRLMAGVEHPDAGRAHLDRGVTVGYLPQEVSAGSGRSVLAEALSGFEGVWRLEAELEDLAAAMARPDPDPALIERYGEVQHRFESLGGYRLETQAKVILGGLGFRPEDMHRRLAELSGGWRMRVALARLLLRHPDLLLLDEPTNHLDLPSLDWLEGFLRGYDGAVVIVSHDRYFLNRMVTSIAEIAGGEIVLYAGDYDEYLVEREARQHLLEARARNQAKRVEAIERFIERFRYKASKARQVQSRIRMLERLERIELGPAARTIRFEFPQPPRTGRVVARLSGVHKAYGAHVVYAGVDMTVERGERVALVGPNGAGKSTLLRILAGVLPFEGGERTVGVQVEAHYYAQHQLDALVPGRTVLEEMSQVAPDLPVGGLRSLLGRFLLGGDAVDKRVAVLSGGEKARLALAKMLVRPAALLCLDEPTNHLDLASKEVLEAALLGFTGTIVFISHDRYFINRIATRIIAVQDGRLASHPGNYDDYLARGQTTRQRVEPSPGAPAGPSDGVRPTTPRRKSRPGEHRVVDREVKALRERLAQLEGHIAALETRLQEMGAALADPDLYRDGERVREVTAGRRETEEQVAWLMKEWEDLSGRLEALAREPG